MFRTLISTNDGHSVSSLSEVKTLHPTGVCTWSAVRAVGFDSLVDPAIDDVSSLAIISHMVDTARIRINDMSFIKTNGNISVFDVGLNELEEMTGIVLGMSRVLDDLDTVTLDFPGRPI